MKFKTTKEFIEYRNKLILKRDQRRKHNLLPLSGNLDYYSRRLIDLDNRFPMFKGVGIVRIK